MTFLNIFPLSCLDEHPILQEIYATAICKIYFIEDRKGNEACHCESTLSQITLTSLVKADNYTRHLVVLACESSLSQVLS